MNLPDIPAQPVQVLLFAFLATAAVLGALRVITARDPFTSALSLIVNFVALGTMYLMLDAEFVALAQILVYAGAVVVLFLFVIAYLGDRRELRITENRAVWILPAGVLVVLGLGSVLATVIVAHKYPRPAQIRELVAGSWGSAQAVGQVFLTRYVLVFEVTSLVLLVAAIGGIVLGLTGRARHDRMRKLMHTRSADQQRRWYESRHKTGTAVGGAHAARSLNEESVEPTEEPVA